MTVLDLVEVFVIAFLGGAVLVIVSWFIGGRGAESAVFAVVSILWNARLALARLRFRYSERRLRGRGSDELLSRIDHRLGRTQSLMARLRSTRAQAGGGGSSALQRWFSESGIRRLLESVQGEELRALNKDMYRIAASAEHAKSRSVGELYERWLAHYSTAEDPESGAGVAPGAVQPEEVPVREVYNGAIKGEPAAEKAPRE